MRDPEEPAERAGGVRVDLVQLADLVRVQLRLHAHRGLGQEVRAQQTVDRERAPLQG